MNILQDLMVGDFVCSYNYYHGYTKGEIVRLTKTQMIVDMCGSEMRYNRIHGNLVGKNSSYQDRIEPITPEIHIKIKRQRLKSSIDAMLLGHDFRKKEITDGNEKLFIVMKKVLKQIMEEV